MTTTSLLLLSLSALTGPSANPVEATESLSSFSAPAPAQASAEDDWSGSFRFGWTQTSGNSHTRSIAVDFDATKTYSEKHRNTVKAYLASGANAGVTSERKLGASYQYDYLAGERHYYLVTAGAEKDGVADLDLRTWLGGGVGYQFYDTETFKYAGEAALTYFDEELSPPMFPTVSNDSIALKLSYKLKYILNERTRFLQDFNFFPAVDDFRDNFLRLDSRLESNLTDRMTGSIQYVLDRDNTPAVGSDRTDHRLVVAVGWSFGG